MTTKNDEPEVKDQNKKIEDEKIVEPKPDEPKPDKVQTKPDEVKIEPKPDTDIDKVLAKARKEEKDKLYPQIEEQKTQIQELKGLVEELKVASGEKDKLLENKEETDLNEQEKLVKKLDLSDKRIEALNKKIEQIGQKHTDELSNRDLQLYKEKAIRESGPEIFTKMVEGSTETEIDASIIKAKQEYEQMKESLETKIKKELVLPAPTSPSVPQSATIEDQVKNVRTMTHEEYAKVKDKLKQEVLKDAFK